MPTPGQAQPPIIHIHISIIRTIQTPKIYIHHNINRNSKRHAQSIHKWYATPTGRDVVPKNYNRQTLKQKQIYGPDI